MTVEGVLTPEEKAFRVELNKVYPALRAFAIKITRSTQNADDLVQDCMVRALRSAHLFQPGTNLRAWLFTIMLNHHRGEYRKTGRLMQLADDFTIPVAPSQEWEAYYNEVRWWFNQLPPQYKEPLRLMVMEGKEYAEIAEILGMAVGTAKSRIFRGRQFLAENLLDDKNHAGRL